MQFQWIAFAKLAAWALAMGMWYVVLPARAAVDLAFLAIIPAVLLGKFFTPIYVPLVPEFRDLILLGHVSLIVIVVIVLLQQRGVPDPGYGFLPSRRDWWIGTTHALYFLVIAIPLVVLLDVAKPLHAVPLWKVAASFVGFLWVLSLSEEFFVRGVLLHYIDQWTGSLTAALLVSSLVFGAGAPLVRRRLSELPLGGARLGARLVLRARPHPRRQHSRGDGHTCAGSCRAIIRPVTL